MTNKKILMVTSLLNYGGASKMFIHLANYLEGKGFEVIIYTYVGKEKPKDISKNIKYIPSILKKEREIIKRLEPIFNIRKIIKEEKPDLIISFLTNSNFYTLIAKTMKKIPVIISERSDPYTENSFLLRLMRMSYFKANCIVFQTKEARSYFNKKIQKIGLVIPNPITRKTKVVASDSERDEIKISHVGRIELKQKRQDIMIKAIEILVQKKYKFKVHFYGDGPDLPKLKEYVSENRLADFIVFEGKVDNVLNHIKDSTMYVLTSDFEGIPNSLLEAMSIGLPVISTDCSPGGARLLIRNLENGIIVPKSDPVLLADKIQFLIDNPNIRKKLSNNAREVNITFENNTVMSNWIKLVESL